VQERENKEILSFLKDTMVLTHGLDSVARVLEDLSSNLMANLKELNAQSKESLALTTGLKERNSGARANIEELNELSGTTAELNASVAGLLGEFKTKGDET
jgi:hypothetical protein